jgi:hypothetical protein
MASQRITLNDQEKLNAQQGAPIKNTNLWDNNKNKITEKYPNLTQEEFNNQPEEVQQNLIDCL